MWWNFVARTHDEIDEARAAWQADDEDRFGLTGPPSAGSPPPASPA